MVGFRVPEPRNRSAADVRALLRAQTIYEGIRAVRRGAVNLLAAAGGALWILLARTTPPPPEARAAGLTAWFVLLGVVILTAALEIRWRRRRDRVATLLRSS